MLYIQLYTYYIHTIYMFISPAVCGFGRFQSPMRKAEVSWTLRPRPLPCSKAFAALRQRKIG